MTAEHAQGLIDTNIVVLRRWVDPEELPSEVAISAITLAELSAGPHAVRSDGEHDASRERARRMEVLQRAEHEFDPIPFDATAARIYGRLYAAISGIGRSPRRRIADIMIAATAVAENLPLYTTNPKDFHGLDDSLTVVSVRRPETPTSH